MTNDNSQIESRSISCPLCKSTNAPSFHKDQRRNYLRCQVCHLAFVPPNFHLSPADEKSVYDLHENAPDDPGYRKFLNRIFEPLQQRLKLGSEGLDFGSGPGPTLSVMFQEAGHTVAIYDPFYAPDSGQLAQRYDFVTATEVVEHLREPRVDLDRVWSCLRPGGTLGLMTKLVLDEAAFSTWHYKNDPTHISFFSRETFTWLADRWNAKITFIGNDVILLRKPHSIGE